MSKNLITEFRRFWKTLTPREQTRMYIILTALRGEDGGNDRLKYRTTARIRGLLFGAKGKREGVTGFFKPNPYDDLTDTHHDLLHRASYHFRNHIENALQVLKPYVKKGKFKDLLRFMR